LKTKWSNQEFSGGVLARDGPGSAKKQAENRQPYPEPPGRSFIFLFLGFSTGGLQKRKA
jgi:hypothetical protein